MAREQEPSTSDPGVHPLYVERLSRLRFQPIGDLREAFLGMYNEEAQSRMGRSALFLYSRSQSERLRPGSSEYKKSEQRDSLLEKQLGAISTRQFAVAKWAAPIRDDERARTGFRINVLFDPETQMLLHARVGDGLNQTLFGRSAVMATLWIPDADIVPTPEERREASRVIRGVLWGEDDPRSEPNVLHPPASGGAKVDHINWTSPPSLDPGSKVA